jgi:hypothetical protein
VWWSGEPATAHTLQVKLTHQPLDGAASHRDAFATQLPPDVPGAVDPEVLGMHPIGTQLVPQLAVSIHLRPNAA